MDSGILYSVATISVLVTEVIQSEAPIITTAMVSSQSITVDRDNELTDCFVPFTGSNDYWHRL